MRTRKHRIGSTYLPHWGNGAGKRAGSFALSLVLVLSNLLTGLSPAIAYAEEAEAGEAIVEIAEQDEETPVAIVEEEPEVADVPAEAVEEAAPEVEEVAMEDEGNVSDPNAPPAIAEEPELPEVPATIDVEYAVVRGDEVGSATESAEASAGDPANRIWLKTDYGLADGEEYAVEATVELDGADITAETAIAPDASFIDVPNAIDLARVSVKVTVRVEVPEEDDVEDAPQEMGAVASEDGTLQEQGIAADEGEALQEEAAPDDTAAVDSTEPAEEAAGQPSGEPAQGTTDDISDSTEETADADTVEPDAIDTDSEADASTADEPEDDGAAEPDGESLDGEAIALQMAELNAFADEVGLEGEVRQLFMMQVGVPLLAAAAQTGTITSVGDTGLYDGISAKEYWTLNNKVAYCISSYLDSPQLGDTFTLYDGTASSLDMPALDYVLYHGYDGKTVTSVGGLDAMRSIVATQAAVWAAVADHGRGVLDFTSRIDGSVIFSNDNYFSRIPGLAVNYPDAQRAAQKLFDDANAWVSAGASGPERNYAKIYLNSGRGQHDGYIYQHMAMVGDKYGSASLKKVSGDESVTAGNPAYSLAGAVYGVYGDSALTQRVGTLTTVADGSSNTIDLDPGTYYVKELTASPGFELDPEVHAVTVESGKTATVTSTEQPITCPVTVRKRSGDTSLTDMLPNVYSLAGAEYTVYDAGGAAVGTLVTDGHGATDTLELPAGAYSVKETKAPEGFCIDKQTYTRTLKPGDPLWTITSTDQPGNDPSGARVQKRDKDTGTANPAGKGTLGGAQFTLRYYDNVAGSASGTPKRSWTFQTNANGLVSFRLDDPVSGDPLYTDAQGNRIFPVGTYTVEETKAPAGYDRDDEVHGPYVVKVAGDGVTVSTLNGGADIYVAEQVKRGDVRWVKTDSDGRRMANVQFRITSATTGESVVVKTDANGIFDSSRPADKRAAWMPHSTDMDASLGAFPYDTYRVEEIRTAGVNEDMVLIKPFTFTIDDSTAGRTQDLGTYINRPVRIATTLTEKDGGHYAPAVGTVTLIDTIRYENLDTSATYWFEGELMDKATGESLGITATGAAFKPSMSSSTATMAYTADASKLAGRTVVCFEELHLKGDDEFAVVHKDIDDVAQTVYFPRVGTTLTSEDGTHEALAEAPITLTDVISYENLEPGIAHTVAGELYDKETGEATGITATASFTPKRSSGTVEIEFTFDGIEWMGHSLVAFETVERGGRTWAVHADIDDVDQTVKILEPEISTTLAEEDGVQEALSESPLTFVDTVEYANLKPNKAYTMSAELMDRATGKSLGITAETVFTPAEKDGTVEVAFEIDDPSMVAGRYIVCFETLTFEGRELAVHADINDMGQTLNVPEIATTLVDADGEHESVRQDETIVLTDTVAYKALRAGETYTMHAELVDKKTGSVIATADAEFVPETEDGTVDVAIEVPLAEVRGKVTVAFETLEREGREVAVHADIDDMGQTVNFPDGETELMGPEGEKTVLAEQPMELVDTVSYRGLIAGKTYTVTGELMDKETGEPTGIKSEPVEFTPTEADGTVEVAFTIDRGFDWMGHELVAFETVSREGSDVFIHADIDDEGQTIEVPKVEIGTTLTDADGNHEVLANGTIVLIDTVEYRNLKPGHEYRMAGELMDKATGESLGITAETVFTPTEQDGTVEVTFEIADASAVEGRTLVAFEELFFEETSVAIHADIEDVDQTVTIPKIGTTLADEEGSKEVVSEGPIILVDTVAYENLVPGRAYTVTGELYDKATGESLGIFASVPLVPEEADGTVEVSFEIADASVLAGRSVVAFETVKHEGREVAIHADLEDRDQTVDFPKIQTRATGDNGTKRVLASETATIVDTVSYANLVPDKTYTMNGVLHVRNADGTDGGELKIDGKAVTAETTFTPTAKNGTVELKFTFDASALAGKSIVVFEGLYDGEKLVAAHADIADAGQTVEIYTLPHTGDATNLSNAGLFGVVGASISAIGVFLGRRRKEDMT